MMEGTVEGLDLYACPKSHRTLRPEREPDGRLVLASTDGGLRYPVRQGIPSFLRYPSAEDASTNEVLCRLNEICGQRGWREALDSVYGPDSVMIQYVTDERRASFVDLLPIGADSVVLEIGPGLGQFTGELARRARRVMALEVVPGQAEFVRQRCLQQGRRNAQVAIGGDDCRLPYADGAFDVVVLNLVFEWCGSRCTDEPHVEAQTRMLHQIVRVLRPGGALYLATKNRYSMHYLLGRRDEHLLNMRFGSALPRWLAAREIMRRGSARAPGMLHSYSALAAMLRESGLSVRQSYWAVPEMRFPMHLVPTDAASIRKARTAMHLVQGAHRATRTLMPFVPARWVKHMAQGLVFLATK